MLKKTLEQNYIEFEDINVKMLSREQLLELGIVSVPVTVIGEFKYLGATPAIITEIISKAGNTL
jgi:glutaredoxin